jgi:hypothetical protein
VPGCFSEPIPAPRCEVVLFRDAWVTSAAGQRKARGVIDVHLPPRVSTGQIHSQREPVMIDVLGSIRLMPHAALGTTVARQGLSGAGDPLMEPRFYPSSGFEGTIADYLTRICPEHRNWTCSPSRAR